MDEAQKRLDEFHRLVEDSEVLKRGSLPPVVHQPTMQVDADSRWDATARFGEHVLIYGFDASFQKEAPLIPHFYIGFTPQNLGDYPIRRHIVEPPEGYEWYSLDADVEAPDPGLDEDAAFEPDGPPGTVAASRQAREAGESEFEGGSAERSPWWWLAIPVVLLGLILGVWRVQARRSQTVS